MERALTNYIRALRAAGAAVSPAEAIDAAQALSVVGYSERRTVKDTLSIVLAKTVEEKELHDRLFDLYFSRAAPPPPEPAPSASSAGAEAEEGGDAAAEDGPEGGGGAPDPADRLVDLAASGDSDRLAVALERAASAAGVDEIRFASQGGYFARRMLETMGVEALETRLMERLRSRAPEAEGEAQTLMDARAFLMRKARAVVDSRFEVFGRAATESFMNDAVANRPIDKLSLRDMERMKAVVARMARRLAARHSRRRRTRDQGRLDIRRTLRANAGHDGVPFDVIWKTRRRDRPSVVALCDVSGSVATYVRFLLMFLYALNETVADLDAFVFSHELGDVSAVLSRMDFETAFEHILLEFGAGGTDYGQALMDLRNHHWRAIDRRTTVLILGDGRSNHADPRLDILAEIADRSKRVVWLCPEPPGRWGTGDSEIPRYRPLCTALTYCATALDLERALDEVLMAYD
jgi:uncharacterized protein with von Willebrand factor type A (vWA) domain